MKRIFAVACLLGFLTASAHATNVWLSSSGEIPPGSEAGEVPMVMQRPGEEGWLWIWGRPDDGKTLLNLSLNVVPDVSDPDPVIWFTRAHLDNPLLGRITFPPPARDIKRYEFVQDSSTSPNFTMVPEIHGLQGFSVTGQQVIGAGIGPDTTNLDPGYDPAHNSWHLGSIHWIAHKPGHVELFLQIGDNGLNNAGAASRDTGVVFGDLQDIVLNGETGRDQNSLRPDAIIWIIPEPSTWLMGLVACAGLIPMLRRRK
jgi:hypothetical protein